MWELANAFQTEDSNSVASPVSVTTASVVALSVPERAVSLTLCADTAVRISEKSDMSNYFVLPANTPVTIDVAYEDYVYLQADSADGNCSFIFHVV